MYTLYSAPDSQYNIIHVSILVTMVTHKFLPKWFPWKPTACGMATISQLASIEVWWRCGLNWRNYIQKLLYSLIFSVKQLVILPCGTGVKTGGVTLDREHEENCMWQLIYFWRPLGTEMAHNQIWHVLCKPSYYWQQPLMKEVAKIQQHRL